MWFTLKFKMKQYKSDTDKNKETASVDDIESDLSVFDLGKS